MYLRNNIYYTDKYYQGKRWRVSLHTGDPKKAKSAEKLFFAFLLEKNIQPQEIVFWDEFKPWYKWYRTHHLKPATEYIHARAIELLEQYRKPYYLRSVTPEFLLGFKDFLCETYEGENPAARNRYIKAIKSMMHMAEKLGKIGVKQCWEIVPSDEETENRIAYHSPEELAQIKNALQNEGDLLTVFYLGWECGLRRGEIAFLEKKDYNPHTHTITICRKPEWKPKTRRSARTLQLKPATEAALLDSLVRTPDSRYIVNLTGERTQAGYLSQKYIRVCRQKLPHLHCYLHKLRHTFGSLLVQGGQPLKVICDLMGHSNILQTEKYAHIGPAQYASALDSLPQI